MTQQIDDVRIQGIRPLMAPEILIEDLPVSESQIDTISGSRDAIARILMGQDDRLVLIIGPCSIHAFRITKREDVVELFRGHGFPPVCTDFQASRRGGAPRDAAVVGKLAKPVGDGLSDFVRRIFLDEMYALHRNFDLIRP